MGHRSPLLTGEPTKHFVPHGLGPLGRAGGRARARPARAQVHRALSPLPLPRSTPSPAAFDPIRMGSPRAQETQPPNQDARGAGEGARGSLEPADLQVGRARPNFRRARHAIAARAEARRHVSTTTLRAQKADAEMHAVMLAEIASWARPLVGAAGEASDDGGWPRGLAAHGHAAVPRLPRPSRAARSGARRTRRPWCGATPGARENVMAFRLRRERLGVSEAVLLQPATSSWRAATSPRPSSASSPSRSRRSARTAWSRRRSSACSWRSTPTTPTSAGTTTTTPRETDDGPSEAVLEAARLAAARRGSRRRGCRARAEAEAAARAAQELRRAAEAEERRAAARAPRGRARGRGGSAPRGREEGGGRGGGRAARRGGAPRPSVGDGRTQPARRELEAAQRQRDARAAAEDGGAAAGAGRGGEGGRGARSRRLRRCRAPPIERREAAAAAARLRKQLAEATQEERERESAAGVAEEAALRAARRSDLGPRKEGRRFARAGVAEAERVPLLADGPQARVPRRAGRRLDRRMAALVNGRATSAARVEATGDKRALRPPIGGSCERVYVREHAGEAVPRRRRSGAAPSRAAARVAAEPPSRMSARVRGAAAPQAAASTRPRARRTSVGGPPSSTRCGRSFVRRRAAAKAVDLRANGVETFARNGRRRADARGRVAQPGAAGPRREGAGAAEDVPVRRGARPVRPVRRRRRRRASRCGRARSLIGGRFGRSRGRRRTGRIFARRSREVEARSRQTLAVNEGAGRGRRAGVARRASAPGAGCARARRSASGAERARGGAMEGGAMEGGGQKCRAAVSAAWPTVLPDAFPTRSRRSVPFAARHVLAVRRRRALSARHFPERWTTRRMLAPAAVSVGRRRRARHRPRPRRRGPTATSTMAGVRRNSGA